MNQVTVVLTDHPDRLRVELWTGSEQDGQPELHVAATGELREQLDHIMDDLGRQLLHEVEP